MGVLRRRAHRDRPVGNFVKLELLDERLNGEGVWKIVLVAELSRRRSLRVRVRTHWLGKRKREGGGATNDEQRDTFEFRDREERVELVRRRWNRVKLYTDEVRCGQDRTGATEGERGRLEAHVGRVDNVSDESSF